METFIFTDKHLNIKVVVKSKNYESAIDSIMNKIDIDELIYAGKLESTIPNIKGDFTFIGA